MNLKSTDGLANLRYFSTVMVRLRDIRNEVPIASNASESIAKRRGSENGLFGILRMRIFVARPRHVARKAALPRMIAICY